MQIISNKLYHYSKLQGQFIINTYNGLELLHTIRYNYDAKNEIRKVKIMYLGLIMHVSKFK